jgi:hypothetical protein
VCSYNCLQKLLVSWRKDRVLGSCSPQACLFVTRTQRAAQELQKTAQLSRQKT